MKFHVDRRLFVAAAVLGALAVFAAALFVALGLRSVVAGPDSAPLAQAPNPGHSWSEIGDLPGTMWHSNNDGAASGLDADTVDGLSSTQIHDADDHVSNADFATTANTADYATSAGNADTVDGKHSNEIHDADNYVSNAGNADTVDGVHASELLGQGDIAIGMGSIAHGAQIPLPQFGDGSTASQSSSVWMVSLRRSIDVDWGRHEEAITCIDCYADANRNVLCRTYHPDKGGWKAATANYIIVGRR